MGLLRRALAMPEAAGLDLDEPEAVEQHARLIRSKRLLADFYRDVYGDFAVEAVGLPAGRQVELGSGGGFLKDVLPHVETSDVIPCARHDLTFSALDMPFAANELAALYMLDVFHHLPDARQFLREADRCLAPGGKVVMMEPANTLWGRYVYQHFHHEPFVPTAPGWALPPGGPMSAANGALPWIVFVRDRAQLPDVAPGLRIARLRYCYPLRYLISGGVSMRQLLPDFAAPAVRFVDGRLLAPLGGLLGMFMQVVLVKSADSSQDSRVS